MRFFSRARDEQQEEDHVSKQAEEQQRSAGTRPDSSPMSKVMTDIPSGLLIDGNETPPRVKVVVHRLDGGLEEGESESRVIKGEGFLIYSPADPTRARVVPTRDIKYVVFGSVDDPALEPDPGDNTTARKAVLRFRDGEWIAAYIAQGAEPDGDGIAIKIRLTELQRVIPAVAAFPSLLETQYVERWTAPGAVAGPPAGTPRRRRSDILEAAASQGRDLTKADVRFEDENQLLETIRRMVAPTGRHIDGLNPMVDARLPDGSRVNAIIRPAAIHGAALTIRKFKDAVLGMDDLTREGSLSPAMAEFLSAAVLGRMNVLVSGGTGSGKTTTLNVIARFIPHNQRVITIEDAAELQIVHPHVIALEHRPPNVEGKGELTIRQLLRNSLRMRPDRILVGEVRGSEALDMLQAMNTGHDGSMSTIHSNSARDALSRLETMVMMASIDIPFEAVRAQIASAVNLIVHQARMPDGRRKVAQIAEVVGYDSNGPILRDIFLLGMGPDLRLEYNATGYVPTALDKAAFYGVQVDQDLFDPVKSRFVPAGSDSMMPVVKDPLMSGQGKSENVVRQVVVVPFSSDRPAAQVQTQATPAGPPPAQTPEMQEEMRKLIDAARSAVADLQAAAPAAPAQTPYAPPAPQAPHAPPRATTPVAPVVYAAPPASGGPEVFTAPQPFYSPQSDVHAGQALEAATAMARATTALGQLAAASSGFTGM